MNKRGEVLFISHGGGPLPLMGDPGHKEMIEKLPKIAAELQRPSAILVISAHWEEQVPTITSSPSPALYYDYYGFPPETYEIEYPSPGNPELAGQIHKALSAAGISSKLDAKRGFDHGMFVPLKLMYPEAGIPCVQLSLVNTLDPSTHIAIGKALQQLDTENLLVLGSGFTFHNMREFFKMPSESTIAKNIAFEDWLEDSLSNKKYSENERSKRLIAWDSAPNARYCHPREEHLIPLHVCYGLAGRACDTHISATIAQKKSGMFYWARNV